ncbi:hypothetical protein SAMN04488063_0010 [Halopelagius inordinatus]|uniref:Uncharacterized protein n=1 Tax=Halopelagius inordinatus TaxID=553467 RepID=A0A1I2WWM4_9EURY|nr:hypothetical protein SAMN04488063_0010 [Halopelagius inordinatus]
MTSKRNIERRLDDLHADATDGEAYTVTLRHHRVDEDGDLDELVREETYALLPESDR